MVQEAVEPEVETFDQQILRATRQLTAEPTLQDVLDRAVELAVDLVEGCDAAGVSLVRRGGRIETPASSDPLATRGDELQYELDEGPCLDAIRETDVVNAPDLADDARWRTWGEHAVSELGVRSMLCIQLYTSKETHGALNLYSRQTGGLTQAVMPMASTLAALAAAAYESARTTDQLQSAIQTRTTIGQAQGIVMERYGLSAPQSFAVLSRLSQDSNTKLVDIATRVVAERKLPTAAEAS